MEFGPNASCQVHHFADASEMGYGTSSNFKLCSRESRIHCAFFFLGKSHVPPLKAVTIPQL